MDCKNPEEAKALTASEDVVSGLALVSNSGCSALMSFGASLGVLGLLELVVFALNWIPGESLNAVYEGRADRVDARTADARTFGLVRGRTARVSIVFMTKNKVSWMMQRIDQT